MIGREEQFRKMKDFLKSGKSEFLAVTGRRRVGKTYLASLDRKSKKHFAL
jgi:AAA+ ATPase superfamily predicted ATPase